MPAPTSNQAARLLCHPKLGHGVRLFPHLAIEGVPARATSRAPALGRVLPLALAVHFSRPTLSDHRCKWPEQPVPVAPGKGSRQLNADACCPCGTPGAETRSLKCQFQKPVAISRQKRHRRASRWIGCCPGLSVVKTAPSSACRYTKSALACNRSRSRAGRRPVPVALSVA